MTYYKFKLLDSEYYNTIIKADGQKQYMYTDGKGWIRNGILTEYFNDESLYYDMYKVITQEEAQNIINKKTTL